MANIGFCLIQGMTRGKSTLKPWSEIMQGQKTVEAKRYGEDIFAEICAKALNRGE